MLFSFHTILVELAFELTLEEINGQYWPYTLQSNIIGWKNNWVDLGPFSLQKQVRMQEGYFSKWLY